MPGKLPPSKGMASMARKQNVLTCGGSEHSVRVLAQGQMEWEAYVLLVSLPPRVRDKV